MFTPHEIYVDRVVLFGSNLFYILYVTLNGRFESLFKYFTFWGIDFSALSLMFSI